ncbi:MAG: hypothetical protein AAB693_02800, partial [Patescibacteria group bacterium]
GSGYTENFSNLVKDLKKETNQCSECFRFFLHPEIGSRGECEICANSDIDPTTLLVLEKDSDLESIKKSKIYNGKYFILGGLVPIVEKHTKSRVRI